MNYNNFRFVENRARAILASRQLTLTGNQLALVRKSLDFSYSMRTAGSDVVVCYTNDQMFMTPHDDDMRYRMRIGEDIIYAGTFKTLYRITKSRARVGYNLPFVIVDRDKGSAYSFYPV